MANQVSFKELFVNKVPTTVASSLDVAITVADELVNTIPSAFSSAKVISSNIASTVEDMTGALRDWSAEFRNEFNANKTFREIARREESIEYYSKQLQNLCDRVNKIPDNSARLTAYNDLNNKYPGVFKWSNQNENIYLDFNLGAKI